jgi:hypothetical protein
MRCVLLSLLAACSFDSRTIGDAGVRDSPPGDTAPACADRLEPNDFAEMASVVSFEGGTFIADNLSICPATDDDVFQISLMDNQSIEAIVMVLAGDGAGIDLVVRNGNGTTIAIGQTLEGLNHLICAPNLPAGIYFLQISDASNAAYRLSVAPPNGNCD